MTTNILLIVLMGFIFIIALIYRNRKTTSLKKTASIEEKPVLVQDSNINKKDVGFNTRIFRRIYPRLPRREFYALRYEARKKRHLEKVAELASRGLYWTPTGVYWMTHALAMQNK